MSSHYSDDQRTNSRDFYHFSCLFPLFIYTVYISKILRNRIPASQLTSGAIVTSFLQEERWGDEPLTNYRQLNEISTYAVDLLK